MESASVEKFYIERIRLFMFIIVSLAVFFRLYRLGDAAMRADTMIYWNALIEGAAPFSMQVTKRFLEWFSLEDSFFWRRFPSAIWGIAAVPVAYGMGRQVEGARLGVLCALFLAIHPFAIQCAREAYFYAPLILGSFLLTWSGIAFVQHLCEGRTLKPSSHFIHASGLFLMLYVHPPGWPMAALITIVLIALYVRAFAKERQIRRSIVVVILYNLVIGLPFLFSYWGPLQLIRDAFGEMREVNKAVWEGADATSTLTMILDAFWGFSWGAGIIRFAFSTLIFISGLLLIIKRMPTRPTYRFVLFLLIGGTLLQAFARQISVSPYEARYLLPVFPTFLITLMCGLSLMMSIVKRKSLIFPWASVFPLAIGIILYLQPAYTVTRLTGHATPYKEIIDWIDRNLPPGTLVLVDRWFEPWNELRLHPSTNVVFTFTMPNEPVDIYLATDWRETAKLFFENNPQSAYLEISKSYWSDPRIGPWTWPRERFSRHQVFTNEAGVRLRDWRLASRTDFYGMYTNNIVVELFYDDKASEIEYKRSIGEEGLVLFSSRWEYLKPWQPIQGWPDSLQQLLWIQAGAYEMDGRLFGTLSEIKRQPQETLMDYLNRGRWASYRLVTSDSEWTLYNLTDEFRRATLEVTAISLSGHARLMVGDEEILFPPALLTTRYVPFELTPGDTDVKVSTGSNNYLLILRASLFVTPCEEN